MDTTGSDAVLARLMHLHPKLIDLSLGRLTCLLDRLGNPEKKLPPVVHIAGTNGKGSTTATLRAIAEAAGYRVHVYTSPHLVRFAERIRVAGKLIEEDALTTLLEECEAANGSDPITFFEVTTAAAFLAFSRVPADLCILEVGLGGRLDATNVIDKPIACAITPVSFDHQQYLGETIEEIAGEKAGIIKAGVPVLVGPQLGAANQVIKAKAQGLKAPVKFFKADWHAAPAETGDSFHYRDEMGKLTLPLPSLKGLHQINNAGLAVAIARTQKALRLPEAAIRAGMGWVRWPARLQDLAGSNLHKLLPEGATLILDGGHNPAAAGILRPVLQGAEPVTRPVTLVMGMINTKDVAGFLKPLAGLVSRVIAVPIEGETAAVDPAYIAATATDIGISGTVARDVPAALAMVSATTKPGETPFVMIAGSLYLAGRVLRHAGLYPD
ncbi:bifunctional folylpolyglutamate synthase/dihydrofolate synthase [Gimibacter soli]|uniref:Dihydrofolate synthase/folylpolyglutamate synthase n=1 Tax=Gimibacter soli TaxID=3024400 RepID=A0AAE9XWU7_9PROT|nr:folylpolyglutamate synthase/dihydrofolate synthase family protein [Gimibacter soli]WCL54879.1 bifunctional folylpolyglutamate synthase/dihydrofolate synthase [Gimibacter soli]